VEHTRGWEWGNFLCHGQKKLKTIIKGFQSCLPTLPVYFPFETSFRTISPENTRTCWLDKIKKNYGGDAVLTKNRFWSIN
jgi:hypothetical protein